MPDYEVTAPDGRTLTISGNRPPTETELSDIFAKAGSVAPMNTALVNGQPVPVDEPTMKTSAGIGSAVGGAVGGMTGGIPGAMLGGAAGEGFEQLVRHARELPAATWDVLKNLVEQPTATVEGFARGAIGGGEQAATAAATQGAMQGVGQAVFNPALKWTGETLMRTALKPALGAMKDVVKGVPVPAVVKTLLDEGINVTPGGIQKLQGLIGSTNDKVRAMIAGAHGDISPLKVASRLNDVAKDRLMQVNPSADLEAISKVGSEFLEHPTIPAAGRATLSPTVAQDLKVGTYRRLGEKYGTPNAAAAIDAEKALARGLKEEIEQLVPKVGPLNLREGKLIDAVEEVGRRVAVAGNRDPVGFAWVAAHAPMTFLAALIDRSPAVKSMLARGLYQSAARAGGVPAQLIRTAVAAIAESGDDTQAQQ